ncbi:MAG: transposase [Deltaproteobacteria bacterium]|nr:transposase [Deltaproteobacteria bacterium]
MHHRRYDPSLLYHVTLRTIDGRWALNPQDPLLQKRIVGALAAAQAATGARVYAFTFMSNHYHGLFAAEGPEQFAAFLCLFHAATSRLVNRCFGRTGPMWRPRAHVQAVLPGEASELAALRYITLQAAKAGLVAHPREWTGASSVRWLLDGEAVTGEYVDQTARTLAARNGKAPGDLADYTEQLEVVMSPLPHLAHLPSDERLSVVRGVIEAALQPPEVGYQGDGIGCDGADTGLPENARQYSTGQIHSATSATPTVDSPAPGEWDGLPTSPPPPRRSRTNRALCIAPSRAAEKEYEASVKDFENAYAAAKVQLRLAAEAVARGESAAFVAFPAFGFAPAGRTYWRQAS